MRASSTLKYKEQNEAIVFSYFPWTQGSFTADIIRVYNALTDSRFCPQILQKISNRNKLIQAVYILYLFMKMNYFLLKELLFQDYPNKLATVL